MSALEWISVKVKAPPHDEPVVYARYSGPGTYHVGIAYWTVSQKWMPEMESTEAPTGFSHWCPLPDPPRD